MNLRLSILLSAALCSAQPAHVALRYGSLVDTAAGVARPNVTVVVRGNMIEEVRETPPGGMETIDLRRAVCLPGLMDLHAHIFHDPSLSMSDSYLKRSSAAKTLAGLRNAQTMLRHGFTTLRDPGDEDRYYGLVDLRNAIPRGDFPGPRLFVAPHALTAPGGHADFNEMAPDVTEQAFGIVVSGSEEMRRAAREEIKLFVTGGVMSAHDDPTVQDFTDEEIQAAVDEAHRHRKRSRHTQSGPLGSRPRFGRAWIRWSRRS